MNEDENQIFVKNFYLERIQCLRDKEKLCKIQVLKRAKLNIFFFNKKI